DQAVTDIRHRLDEVRSFIVWTAPLYVLFVGVGLYESHLTVTLAFAVLLAVLVAFGLLDGLVLATLQGIRVQIAVPSADLTSTRARLERLSRSLWVGGALLGAAGACAVVIMSLG
ncbi:MAG TPA: hypothetical protein VEY12_09895, partial [Thermoplasmata archaeon]|nr:hypothetical protein [Thermoplasmata archaeon]